MSVNSVLLIENFFGMLMYAPLFMYSLFRCAFLTSKHIVSFQRFLYLTIGLLTIARVLQNFIVVVEVLASKPEDENQGILYFNESVDVFTQYFSFLCYLTLASFWMEQYWFMQISVNENNEEIELKKKKTKKWINAIYWIVVIIALVIVIAFVSVLISLKWSKEQFAYLLTRLIVRLLLTLGTSTLICFFGTKLYFMYRRKFKLVKHTVNRVLVVTVYVTIIYCLLGLHNILSFVFREYYRGIKPVKYVLFLLAVLMEVSSFWLLILSLGSSRQNCFTEIAKLCRGGKLKKVKEIDLTNPNDSTIFDDLHKPDPSASPGEYFQDFSDREYESLSDG